MALDARSVVYRLRKLLKLYPTWYGNKLRILLLFLLIASNVPAQDRKVDPTWLHQYVPSLREHAASFTSATCHYTPIFGEGDAEDRILRSVSRFGELLLDAGGSCKSALYDREEEIYFVLEGSGILHYGEQTHHLRSNDFTYLAPGMKHSLDNNSERAMRVLLMGFKIPPSISIGTASPHPKIVNMDDL